ncbi:MAG: hypothetical protein HOV80_16590 [Polyangiaceae bacterium]|nr:hypothetical protein [Polyangiaceae bacterium]
MRASSRAVAVLISFAAVCCACRNEPRRGSDEQTSTVTKETGPALSAATPSPKVPAQADETTEPKLSFTVRVGSTELHLSEGDQLPAKGTFTDPSVSVTVDPERVFSHAGLSFAYPRNFSFEADLSDAHSHSWTLSGNDVKIMVFRFSTELSIDSFSKEIAEGFGPSATISPISIQLGSTEYSGQRVRAKIATHAFTQDIFSLPAIKGKGRFLVLQDDASGNKPESQPTRALLAKTFRITQ